MDAKLVVIGGEARVSEVILKLPTTIGRGRSTSLALPHPLVSRRHCEIYEEECKLVVNDLGSLNGTFVGDQRITEPTFLMPGELLTVGTVTFRAVYEVAGSGVGNDNTGTEHSEQTETEIADEVDEVEELEELEEVEEIDELPVVEFAEEEDSELEEVAEVEDLDEIEDLEEVDDLPDLQEAEEVEEVEAVETFDVNATIPTPTKPRSNPKPKSKPAATPAKPSPKPAAQAQVEVADDDEVIAIEDGDDMFEAVETTGDTEKASHDTKEVAAETQAVEDDEEDDLQSFLKGLG